MKRLQGVACVSLAAFLLAGCGGSLRSYVREGAPWQVVHSFALLPFTTPSENPVQRELVTRLFAEELRRAGFGELREIPLESPVGTGVKPVREIGREYQVDAVFSGAVDDTHGTVVHVRLQDAATEEILWSATYTLGVRAEFLSLRTQQQQLQRAFTGLVKKLAGETGLPRPAPAA